MPQNVRTFHQSNAFDDDLPFRLNRIDLTTILPDEKFFNQYQRTIESVHEHEMR